MVLSAISSQPFLLPSELDTFVELHGLGYMAQEIAPWITTVRPLDETERRYWTITVDGKEWVSRCKAMSNGWNYEGVRGKDESIR